jgi:hypothetical protein
VSSCEDEQGGPRRALGRLIVRAALIYRGRAAEVHVMYRGRAAEGGGGNPSGALRLHGTDCGFGALRFLDCCTYSRWRATCFGVKARSHPINPV